MKRVPETCATCKDAEKWPDETYLVWICDHPSAKRREKGVITMCTKKHKLPVPPAWCPKRGKA